MASYCTILAVAFLGAFNGPWYLLLVGAAVLAAIALYNQRQYRPRFSETGMVAVFDTAAHASAAHALLASLAAYGLGAVARLIFL